MILLFSSLFFFHNREAVLVVVVRRHRTRVVENLQPPLLQQPVVVAVVDGDVVVGVVEAPLLCPTLPVRPSLLPPTLQPFLNFPPPLLIFKTSSLPIS
jgi:hypothetical protein